MSSDSDKPKPTAHGRAIRDITPYPPPPGAPPPRTGNATFDHILDRLDVLPELIERLGAVERSVDAINRAICEVKSIVAANVSLASLTNDPKDAEGGPIALVLVVEDNPPLRRAMGRVLQSNGMRSMAASSAEEAQGLLERNAIDVAVVDIRLSGNTSGIDLARWIRTHHAHVGIVILTGLLTREDAAAAEELGIRVLPKPFENLDLIEAIREAYGRQPPPPAAAAPG